MKNKMGQKCSGLGNTIRNDHESLAVFVAGMAKASNGVDVVETSLQQQLLAAQFEVILLRLMLNIARVEQPNEQLPELLHDLQQQLDSTFAMQMCQNCALCCAIHLHRNVLFTMPKVHNLNGKI